MKQLLASLLLGLFATCVVAPELPGQRKTPPKPGKKSAKQVVKGDSLTNYRIDRGEKAIFEDPGEEYQPGSNVPLHKRVAIKGLGSFVQAFVGTDPGRLAPGQSGELRVILALKGKYVLEDGMHLDLRYRRKQGKISLGQWHLLPAGVGKLDTQFKGRSVYDNTATIAIPVSVGSQAIYGQKHLGLEVEVDVSNGESGGFHGRYMMDVRAQIEVGRPLPVIKQNDEDREIAAPLVSASGTGGAEPSQSSSAGGGELSTEPVTGEELVGAGAGDLQPGRVGEAPGSSSESLGTSGEGGINWLLYSVPAVLLLLLLAMALRKSKA